MSSRAPRRFHHAEPGTPEPQWLLDARWSATPSVDLAALPQRFDELVVAAAHPDDETLAVGGVLAGAYAVGLPVRVVVATDGAASHPDASAWSPSRLAAVRRAELDAALGRLAPGSPAEHLGLPDGGLAGLEPSLADELAARCGERTLLLAPWTGDGHPDHDALGRAAEEAGRRRGAAVAHYPLWLWHWGRPDDLDWSRAHVVELDRGLLDAKAAAVAEHASQTEPLGPCPGDRPVVTEPVLRRAGRLVELVLSAPGALPLIPARPDAQVAAPFDAMYDEGPDPWGFEGSFFERRKRDLVAAVLGRQHYHTALEIGCATGLLTTRLAERADHVVAVDVSERALAVARAHTPDGVQWRAGRAPEAVPDGPVDLVVLSEVGYFLTPLELLETLRRLRVALARGGEVVLVHWRHPTRGVPLDGPAVHAQALSALADLAPAVHYEDADVLLDVLGGPAGSVASREGRV
ncbi:PIG-L family deacetylase [Phycicoccus endophyticus]|uniref:PIG-L family deacetylase n=1 Tax=Phycicoccus endophyticus TaxID=1690220 RepID=A0A7G9QZY9_9MICO|nr:PIG-L family deacetylase [Phycicoccus endophyticus]NHI20773.1 methyltransferase domain-containing protein [Phycicoccus endophyticus]QNN48914.1 PIG-L family deacetylase [Phycicoccus endophyticus]GGL43824.1 hypothetical protein GCM10012283_28000 [Phycicoccus endophyticus]